MNRIVLKGRLVADPELRMTQSNVAHVRFKVAVDKYTDKDNEKAADFIDCDAWRKTAEFLAKYTSKGQEILIEGALHNNNYEKQDGTKVYSYVVTAERAEFCGSKGSNSAAGNTASNDAAVLGDLGDFEEILSDGDVPF